MNEILQYADDNLCIESSDLTQIAREFGTPCYVYSSTALSENIEQYQSAFGDYPHRIAYAVKANSNLSILKKIHQRGLSFDVVSQGEFQRLLAINVEPEKVFFSGVGKTTEEISFALKNNIGCINVESLPELKRTITIAKKEKLKAPIAIRINPNVDPKTHPYISTGLKHNKFGVDLECATECFQLANDCNEIELKGISFHIGSQLTAVEPILEAFESTLAFIKDLTAMNIHLSFIDIGGGLGVAYEDEQVIPNPSSYLTKVIQLLKESGLDLQLVIEPGRSIVASAGLLLTEVQYVKETPHGNFLIVDAGMNDFGRPSLYNAYHQVLPVERKQRKAIKADIVGPICESSDFLALDRQTNVFEKELIALLHTGAYGMTMSSNYNTRGKVAEVLVSNSECRVIRQREDFQDLIKHEVEFI